jgi:hypothetical protein
MQGVLAFYDKRQEGNWYWQFFCWPKEEQEQ